MQFHYVINYDTETQKWTFDYDLTDSLDGNVWSDDDGFFWPAPEYPGTEEIDTDCRRMLEYVIPVFPPPIPQEA